MQKKHLNLDYEVVGFDELANEYQDLILAARTAADGSYAPYSHFNVGAAVLLDNGIKVTGSNQENVAYPSGLCAERVALFTANANFPDSAPLVLAIAAYNNGKLTDFPVTPCGACRQVMVEIEKRYNKSFVVLMSYDKGVIKVDRAADLMPLAFDL